MDRTERFYVIDQLLQNRLSTPTNLLMRELEVSRSTLKRDLTYMRDRLHAPIVWDARVQGYRYEKPGPDSPKYSLPGLWLNSTELHALLTMEHLLDHLQPGFLSSHVQPLRKRIRKILDQGDHPVEELVRRIRIFSGVSTPVDVVIFQRVAEAMLSRNQIFACHLNRATDESLSRHISPQRLVYYLGNWYLDGWCHLREGLRTFKLTNLTSVENTDLNAIDIDEKVLDAELTSGFGIFVGEDTRNAVLRFSAYVSRWVQHEIWHSKQDLKFDQTGQLVLTVPFSNDPELIRRILQYGPDVEVLQPENLRNKVASRLSEASAVYEK